MENTGKWSGADTSFVLGCHLAIKTSIGEEFEGEVVMYDKDTSLLILQDPGSSGAKRNLRFLKTTIVRDVTVLGQTVDPPELHIQQVDPAVLLAREEAAIRQAEAEAQHFGKDVTSEAQELYDALRKTLPVRWEGKTIVVMDDVRISPPYLPEDTVGGDQSVLERVRKVLENERKRLDAKGR